MHLTRTLPSLLSTPHHAPLALITLPIRPSTPSPHATPPESVLITGSICLDISSPLPFSPFASPASLSPSSYSPALILNPSSTPLLSLAWSQFSSQAKARAAEQSAFVLRCDSAEGLSGLLAPDGSVRVVRLGEEGWWSWEVEVDVERAERGAWWSWIGRGSFGAVAWARVVAIGVVLAVLAGKRGAKVRWGVVGKRIGGRVRERTGALKWRAAGEAGKEVEREEQRRLVDVD